MPFELCQSVEAHFPASRLAKADSTTELYLKSSAKVDTPPRQCLITSKSIVWKATESPPSSSVSPCEAKNKSPWSAPVTLDLKGACLYPQVFAKGPAVYAFRGLAGKLGPIGVHVGLILTMGGCAYSATAGFDGSSMTPQGQVGLLVKLTKS